MAVARELTKLHEQVWRGTLGGAAEWAAGGVRGEVVLVLAGSPPVEAAEVGDELLLAALAEQTAGGARTRGAVDRVAADHGVPRRRVYELALQASRPEQEPTTSAQGTPAEPARNPGPGTALDLPGGDGCRRARTRPQ